LAVTFEVAGDRQLLATLNYKQEPEGSSQGSQSKKVLKKQGIAAKPPGFPEYEQTLSKNLL
jgi:hypothetical protein